jgi:hypothetical protein
MLCRSIGSPADTGHTSEGSLKRTNMSCRDNDGARTCPTPQVEACTAHPLNSYGGYLQVAFRFERTPGASR